MDRYARLASLARANAGRRRLPNFLQQLSRRLAHEVTADDVLPIERADALAITINPLRARGSRRGPPGFTAWSPDAMNILAPRLGSFLRSVDASSVLLLSPASLGIGPVRLATGVVAPHIRALAEGETEECVLVTDDGLAGLALYYHAGDHAHGEPTPYELVLWGDRWMASAALHLPFELAANTA